MKNTILSPAKYEVCFLQAEGNGAAQIHCRLCTDYGNTGMTHE